MKITEVRIFPTESKDGKLKAFATMTFDDWFVVRNVKVIQGNSGLFVAMPSRKAVESCPKCRFKNVVGSKFCNQCGQQLKEPVILPYAENEKVNSHMDIAHPITQDCRVYIQEQILKAYKDNDAAVRENVKTEQNAENAPENPARDVKKEEEQETLLQFPELALKKDAVEEEAINVADGSDIEL